jgi:hypothetical protein
MPEDKVFLEKMALDEIPEVKNDYKHNVQNKMPQDVMSVIKMAIYKKTVDEMTSC